MKRGWLLAAVVLAGCSTAARQQDGLPGVVPIDIHKVPDAVPVSLPKSRYGNPKHYEVLGERYFVLSSAAGYKERGRASWYGTKFHGRRTSSGEPYDMFAMTAAHKTLPLPTFVRVTRLSSGKSIVVKVNDRGPFHVGRIIDLSYTAAAKLDMIDDGSAEVEVEALAPGTVEAAAPPAAPTAGFLEIGATADAVEAVALREDAAGLGLAAVEIRSEERGEAVWHRVLVGPFRDEASLLTARRRLEADRHEVRTVAE